ncbi:MAG: sensor domain-containing diguanylate cyclase [Nitrospirae bacterium]|nr:sensor domain-containing diguanylate cyclase [Nitrospirota bacterium]
MSEQKEIAVLAKNRTVLKFLETYFAGRKLFRADYFKTEDSFLKHIKARPPAAVISEISLLQSVSDRITRFPSVAIIDGDVKKGIEKAVGCSVRNYVLRPYLEIDLENRLESVILERDTFARMENEMKELEAVVELTQLISGTLDSKELLFKIVKKIAELIPVTRCSIIRVDWLHRSAFVVASFEDPLFTGIRLSLKKYPEIVEALTSKKPVVIRNVETDPLMKRVRDIIMPLGIRSILVLPIFYRDKVIGTLFLRTSRTDHSFSSNEVKLLHSLANASANTLYNAFLFEQIEDEKTRLEKLAITDYLTGIYNIRYFYNRIIEEFSRSQRYGLPISCLMFDIDFFKKINDVYGHKTGDHVLKEFAQLLKRHTRKSDVLARYGGEEFILLLPQTAREGAISEAERIRECIRIHKFKGLKNRKGLTVSVGISVFPHPKIKTHDELISFADNALFTAKNRGRNQVALYEE